MRLTRYKMDGCAQIDWLYGTPIKGAVSGMKRVSTCLVACFKARAI